MSVDPQIAPSPSPRFELAVPDPGTRVLALVSYSLVLFFLALAVYNVLHLANTPVVSVVASLLWLGIIGLWLWANATATGGWRLLLIDALGPLSRRHYVRAVESDEPRISICVGYKLWGRDWHSFVIPLSSISAIGWQSGQATALAGRDRNDWFLCLRYRWRKQPQQPDAIRRGCPAKLFVIGPCAPREQIEAFARQLAALLLQLGAEPKPSRRACEYRFQVERPWLTQPAGDGGE